MRYEPNINKSNRIIGIQLIAEFNKLDIERIENIVSALYIFYFTATMLPTPRSKYDIINRSRIHKTKFYFRRFVFV